MLSQALCGMLAARSALGLHTHLINNLHILYADMLFDSHSSLSRKGKAETCNWYVTGKMQDEK